MSTGPLRNVVIAFMAIMAVSPLAAEPVALRGYNSAISESSISGISSGAFMAVQFGTAWSSVIRGVGVIAGGPYWCAKADADDFINGFTAAYVVAPTALASSFQSSIAEEAQSEVSAPRMLTHCYPPRASSASKSVATIFDDLRSKKIIGGNS